MTSDANFSHSEKMKTLAYLAWFAGACALALAQTNKSEPSVGEGEWRIPGTESFRMHSSIVKRDFEIMVALPRKYSGSGKHPVLYVLDANGAFPIAVEIARFLKFDPSMKEEPIIVGIGYPVGRYWNTIPHRTRDFTPTAKPETVARWSQEYEFSADGSGGAAKFLQALGGEIIPLVEGRYRIDERRRALYGYSTSGLFAYYALLQRPELFQSYLIGAPYFGWDDSAAWKFEEKFSETRRDLPARVFLTVGLLDTELVPVVEKLDALFRARQYQKFTWQTEYFPGETHVSAIALCLSRGIRWLYGDMTPQSSSQ